MSAVVVIGAGVDELVAAHLLAAGGHEVTVLEEFAPPVDGTGWMAPQIARALGLQGIAFQRPDPWLRALVSDGGTLELWHDMGRSVEAIRRVSARDAQAWPHFCERMARLAALFERLLSAPPPSLVDLRFALRVRRLGRRGMEDLMRLLPMPVAELLDDWFESDALKGALGALAVRDLQQGPRSAGTAFRLLYLHAMGNPPGVFRTPASNAAQLLRTRPGISIRETTAARIAVRAGRASGVALASGEELPAALVVCGADPARALLELVEPGWLDPDLARALRHVRRRGVAARISFEVEGAAAFQTLSYAPSLDHIERAYDDGKYGRVSEQPCLDLTAKDGRAEVHFQYAPHALRDGAWDDAARARLAEVAASVLGRHLPAARTTAVLAPPDLEARYGWPQGQPHHAELSLDQALWMRPLPELAGYRTPIDGLWLCGPSMHPGAGVAGAAGYNCAREILRA